MASDARVGTFEQWDYGFDFYAARTLRCADGLEKLESYVDGLVLEVFVNDGYATMTSRLFGSSERTVVDAFDGAGSFCQMGSFVISEA